ncbi:MAG TPA: putative quinol monooxygenase [Gemmataceae bacterium]|nr:putative quinol monooxygenase [Gemmataceae bacterium]
MIHVIAAIEVKPGQREAFLTEFRKLIAPVRAEAGCIEYGPAVDLPTNIPGQIPFRKDVVTIVEKWKSLDALRAHLTEPHMNQYRDRVKDIVVGVQLQILEPG